MNRGMRVLAVGLTAFALLAKGSFAAAHDDALVECVHQKYALCATANCFVYNQVAYCECDFIKKKGTSISASLDSPEGDICDLNRQGKKGGYVMSTFSVPTSVLKPDGNQALYTCPEGSTGAYAQCDGGFCFKSTKGKRFPGFEGKLKGQIICACPITFAPEQGHSYQIAGDYDGQCDPDVFEQCQQKFPDNMVPQGTIIPVGAPPGSALVLGTILDGSPPDANECTLEN